MNCPSATARALNYHDFGKARVRNAKNPELPTAYAAWKAGPVIRIAVAEMREKTIMTALLAEARRNEKTGAQTGFRCAMRHLRLYLRANGKVRDMTSAKTDPKVASTSQAGGLSIGRNSQTGQFLVSARKIDGLSKLGFSNDEVYKIVAPRRTLARRKQNNETLTLAESDRVLRLERISAMADRVFADHEKAQRWLRKESRALDGARPIDLLQSETGAHIVEQELHRIDHGMFA